MDPEKYRISPDAKLVEIDLEKEEFILADGSRLTEKRAAEILAKRNSNLVPGRKSLSRDGSHSPIVQFRSPRKVEGQALADELGISLSELARRAYDNLLDAQRQGQHRDAS